VTRGPDRLTQHLLLLLLGVVVLLVAGTDRYLDYVRAGFRPFLLAAGAVTVGLAVAGLLRRRPGGHGHPGPAVGWLLAAPVAVVLVVVPPALGSYTAGRQAAPVVVPAGGAGVLGPDDPGAGPRTMRLFDYLVASQTQPAELAGRRVRLVGFVSPRAGGGWYVTRFVVNCCAADATAVRVAVPAGPPGVQADQWVEVVGTARTPLTDPAVGYPEPALDAASVQVVQPPAETYE
jgi:uncharacterized repeat protein (TIGR03943 family)